MWSNPDGETMVRHRRLRDETTNAHGTNWTQVVLETPPDRNFDPSAQIDIEPKQTYLNRIFHPGKFPLTVINRALTVRTFNWVYW